MSNSLDPDQDQHSVGPVLGPNRLQRLSVDNKSRCKYRLYVSTSYQNYIHVTRPCKTKYFQSYPTFLVI